VEICHACAEVVSLQAWVANNLGVQSGVGNYWLPIVLTAKGPLYAEVIGQDDQSPTGYRQPISLKDSQRQPLYRLARELLAHLSAPPATYMLQFGWWGETLVYDRLYPFPTAPAVASLGIQKPDLFECHWRCLTAQPIFDILILASQC
jgi:hypothetical protein